MSPATGTSVPAPRDIWTRLVIDPLADPLAAWLARRPAITPNRVTLVSGALGVAAVVCFATGHLRAGGLLFLLRFFADCIDGKVARAQRSSSARGALLDVATDVVCVVGAYAALGYWAVVDAHLAPVWIAALLAAVGWYGWTLAHRKHLASLAGQGDGGSRLYQRQDVRLAGGWLALCRRLGMRPVPWAVEVETLVLGLAPVLGPRWVGPALHLALVFYVTATAINLGRMARIAAALDRAPVPDAERLEP